MDLLVWAARQTVAAIKEIVLGLLAYGVTLADIMADTVRNPENIIANFVQAFREAGKTVEDISRAIAEQVESEAQLLIAAAYNRLVITGQEFMDAFIQIGGGAVFTLVGLLLEIAGLFRSLTDEEETEARRAFGDSLPYNMIHVFIGSFVANIASGNTGGDTGVGTMRIVHFPDGTVLSKGTPASPGNFGWLMHELTHVWQGEYSGPVYMAEALHAQGNGGYDYAEAGKTKEQTLIDAHSNGEGLDSFNPEQQGDIVRDYYDRLFRGDSVAAWEPFIDEVKAA